MRESEPLPLRIPGWIMVCEEAQNGSVNVEVDAQCGIERKEAFR
jgi:hypothetical protein